MLSVLCPLPRTVAAVIGRGANHHFALRGSKQGLSEPNPLLRAGFKYFMLQAQPRESSHWARCPQDLHTGMPIAFIPATGHVRVSKLRGRTGHVFAEN